MHFKICDVVKDDIGFGLIHCPRLPIISVLNPSEKVQGDRLFAWHHCLNRREATSVLTFPPLRLNHFEK